MRNTPINKGNYAFMESAERERLFDAIRGQGWEEEYRAYRQNWAEWGRTQYLADYPLQVDLELSNICNLACPMCFRNKNGYNTLPNVKLMKWELITKVLDEIADKVPALRLSLRGEPTLHPRLPEVIRYAKERNIREISFLSNGSRLTEDYVEELVRAGLDWLTISIDGLGETYNQIRRPLIFEETIEKVKGTQRIKKRLGTCKPAVKVQSIWPAIREIPQVFYDTFAPHVDLVAFNPLIDYLGNDDPATVEYIEDFSCPQLYQRLIVGATGRAMMCTNDEMETQDIGNAVTMSIHDIWKGEKLMRLRELHNRNRGFLEIPVCSHCFIPRKTTDVEKMTVNGREIPILNYTNRSQVIGE